ncbi:Bro-N domain-containing protein [Roseovarius sp.]|uniref:BRO-N domain-containing protein n=1 Tax=Roseovarius sp. TaxID=1486281 RepID=UPI003A96904A
MAPSLYDFKGHSIRVIEIDNAPWFVAADVCKALGFALKPDGTVNTTHAIRSLSVAEVITHRMSYNRGRSNKLVSESGLYKLIMRSDKPEAKAFQDWVRGTLLPSIRKDGWYIMGEDDDRPDGLRVLQGTLESPDMFP